MIKSTYLATAILAPPSQKSGTFGVEEALNMIEARASGGGK
jgi:hypothetical protein